MFDQQGRLFRSIGIEAAELAALMKELNVTQPVPATPNVINTNPLANIQYDLDKLNRRFNDSEFKPQQWEFNESVRRNEEAHQRWEESKDSTRHHGPSI